MGILTTTFYRWYKEFLSDFRTDEQQKKLHENDLSIIGRNGKIQNILVPILKIENMGTGARQIADLVKINYICRKKTMKNIDKITEILKNKYAEWEANPIRFESGYDYEKTTP
jgi:hypothetical protein